jgi:hypothetical protein
MDATKSLAAILSKGAPKEEVEEDEAPEEIEGLDLAAEDVSAAMKSGDAQALKSALLDFVDLVLSKR